jgi:hypothetical protein
VIETNDVVAGIADAVLDEHATLIVIRHIRQSGWRWPCAASHQRGNPPRFVTDPNNAPVLSSLMARGGGGRHLDARGQRAEKDKTPRGTCL